MNQSPSNVIIAQIVAISKNYCIGQNNELPWHLPEDLQHFKHMTTHNANGSIANSLDSEFNGVMIMGRKTFESMRSRPLPKRVNIIVTRQVDYIKTMSAKNKKITDWITQGKIQVVDSLEKAVELGKNRAIELSLDTLWIIGGGDIFRQALPITQRIELTEVNIEVKGDAFYPEFSSDFKQTKCSQIYTDQEQNIDYKFITYNRL